MVNAIKTFFVKKRYQIAIIGLLFGGSLISVFLVFARIAYSDSQQYRGLIWNLFLAWIPFILAFISFTLFSKRIWLYITIPAFAFLWLIFFPNAPYILTDLQYLNRVTTSAPLWFDIILLIWFTWTGLLLGIISLYMMHEIVHRLFGRLVGWIFVFIVSGLSSAGIYVGRFMRWNSWDILQNPSELAIDILGLVIDPSLRLFAFTSLFALFFLFVYVTLYTFAHLFREEVEQRNPKKTPAIS
ncbi:MAG: DUF1361 domain-containing protein [Anaerolineae bacterium]|nr:DUF1361 domain-containing protein [Anaerolineae bacterium]MDK1080482.1 DUF1361 domain-containing protein [Anaerolineae bacterium]MDK1117277.1 DUF1361 domain-containing protein [Anaerolineae bacterium]